MNRQKLSLQVMESILITLLSVGCSALAATPTPIPPTATPVPPTETPIPPTPTEKPVPTLNTSLGIFMVDEARMVGWWDCKFYPSLPPCRPLIEPSDAWLIVYLKPLEGKDISQVSPLPFLDQNIYVIDGTGERFGCIMTGDDGTRLFIGFPIFGSNEYTLYWPGNQKLVLENIVPMMKVE